MDLPSLTASTIVVKLSSLRIISDASLETSVPEIPIAIPMCAYYKAGASLTPSPVMATICFLLDKSWTSFRLWAGSALERTNPLLVLMA